MKKPPSKLAQWRERMRDRLVRSSRFFLIGLIVACGIEVLIDWNATLFEINILRDRMRERGYNYAGILSKSTIAPLTARDPASLAVLSSGLFDDDDVAFVRFTTAEGVVVYERVDTDYEELFRRRRGIPFREYFASQLTRDADGIVNDPAGLRQRMNASRYRDFAQQWNDFVDRIVTRFTGPKPIHAGGNILYQDRLRTPDKQRDDAVTYAIAAVRDETGKAVGTIVVAFSMDRTNAAIRAKYLKGLGMVVFFVGLILVQNVVSRRDKLRLLDLEARYALAKKALRDAFPSPILDGELRAAGAVDQAPGAVDGMAWDVARSNGVELAIVDPDGDGVDSAAVALHALRTLRADRSGTLMERAQRVGAAVMSIPLSRPVGILLVRVGEDGTIEGIASPIGDLRGAELTRTAIDVPEGIVGPLHAIAGNLPRGGRLVGAFGHGGTKRLNIDDVAAFIARSRGELDAVVADAATWARGRASALTANDLAIVAITRT
jgi:hypothetical protein